MGSASLCAQEMWTFGKWFIKAYTLGSHFQSKCRDGPCRAGIDYGIEFRRAATKYQNVALIWEPLQFYFPRGVVCA